MKKVRVELEFTPNVIKETVDKERRRQRKALKRQTPPRLYRWWASIVNSSLCRPDPVETGKPVLALFVAGCIQVALCYFLAMFGPLTGLIGWMAIPALIGAGAAYDSIKGDRFAAFAGMAGVMMLSPLALIFATVGYFSEVISHFWYRDAIYDSTELQKLQNPIDRPDSIIFADALRRKLSGIESELVGEQAPLVVIGRNLQSRLEDVQKLGEQIELHRSQSTDVARSEVLDLAAQRHASLLKKLACARTSHEAMIAKTRASLAVCAQELDRMTGMGDDTHLIEELARQEADAEDVVQASRQAMEQTYSALVRRMSDLQASIGAGMLGPSQKLFTTASGDSLTEDLNRYEELAEAAHANFRVGD